MTQIYEESIQDKSSKENQVISIDYVGVRLLMFDDNVGALPTHHYVIEKTVKVDGKYTINQRNLLNQSMFDAFPAAHYIRAAIEEFDSLLAVHPTLEKQDES